MSYKTKGILIGLLSGIVFITVFAIGFYFEPEWLSYLLVIRYISSSSLTRFAIKRYLEEDSFVEWSYTSMSFILGLYILVVV